MKIEELRLTDLFYKALELPVNTFTEITISAFGDLCFSQPLTGNTFSKNRIGSISSIAWDDFKGVHLRNDNKIEFENLGNVQGENYPLVRICDKPTAIQILVAMCSTQNHDLFILYDKIKKRDTLYAHC